MLERDYQAGLIQRMKHRFPGIIVLKNDTGYQQGIPDLSFFYGSFWGWLEVKPRERAKKEPNQDYFVELGAELSFAAFIFPENEEEVLDAIQRTCEPRRATRVS